MKQQAGVLHTLSSGDAKLEFDLIRSRRKTLSITVEPDGKVIVRAPQEAGLDDVLKRVGQRLGWISDAQREFESFRPRTPERRYVSGETHRFLGRQYRLRLIRSRERSVLMERGWITVCGDDLDTEGRVQQTLSKWYRQRAQEIFPHRLAMVLDLFAVEQIRSPSIAVRRMTKRWGSLSRDGALMVLNTRLVEAAPTLIDYVVAHELAHSICPDHGSGFVDVMDRKMPDWRRRKQLLERALA